MIGRSHTRVAHWYVHVTIMALEYVLHEVKCQLSRAINQRGEGDVVCNLISLKHLGKSCSNPETVLYIQLFVFFAGFPSL